MNIDDIFQIIRLDDQDSLMTILYTIDINLVNNNGQSLVHEAAANNSKNCLEILLKNKANPDSQDKRGMTPLHYAAANSSLESVALLKDIGANASISDEYGNQPLWTATFNARGNYDIVSMFKGTNADPLHKNESGKSPLDFSNQIKDETLTRTLENI